MRARPHHASRWGQCASVRRALACFAVWRSTAAVRHCSRLQVLASGFGLVRGGILGQPNIPQWYAQANGRVHFVQGCCILCRGAACTRPTTCGGLVCYCSTIYLVAAAGGGRGRWDSALAMRFMLAVLGNGQRQRQHQQPNGASIRVRALAESGAPPAAT